MSNRMYDELYGNVSSGRINLDDVNPNDNRLESITIDGSVMNTGVVRRTLVYDGVEFDLIEHPITGSDGYFDMNRYFEVHALGWVNRFKKIASVKSFIEHIKFSETLPSIHDFCSDYRRESFQKVPSHYIN